MCGVKYDVGMESRHDTKLVQSKPMRQPMWLFLENLFDLMFSY
jgi:hypothetical protein